MRIRELAIDRFGVWRDVTLPLDPHGVTVFYGPNEAGKSTLMRFVRGVLYGFQPTDGLAPGPQAETIGCGGALQIDHEGQQYRLKRIWQSGTRGQLEINGRPVADQDPLIESIRGGTGESLFQNVYAIGLHELQQLATLNGEDVAKHVYGLSLGPDGQRILNTQSHLSLEQQRLLGGGDQDGEINTLLKQLDAVEREIAQVGAPEPTQIVIRPYDTSTIKDIEKAIIASDLGFNPQNDGRVIRINIPPLSTEVRRKMVTRIKELSEEAKVSIRNIRRDANKAADQAEKDKTLSEDQRDDVKDQVQEFTKKYETQIGDLAAVREKEVLED